MGGLRSLVLVCIMFLCCAFAGATIHYVGESSGWGPNSDVGGWAASAKLLVGDTLVFQYTAEHNLQEVGQLAFMGCDTTNPIQEYNDGYTKIELTQQGSRFFICGQLPYCENGLKMVVDVQ